jgi:hypothetical protein
MVARLRGSFSDRRIALLASLAILSLFAVGLIAVRILYTGSSEHVGIAWNLLLAWIPFLLALVVYDRAQSGLAPPRSPPSGCSGFCSSRMPRTSSPT